MAADRRKWMQAAERLLKQGKLQAALAELERASENAPDDLLTLNRLGDLLVRQGRNAEAVGYYRKIANQFADGGFLPKSVAIHKKILRIDPNNLESLVGLGELYLSLELHGEARNYLLHAANQYVESKSFEQAREVYEKLAAAEPDEPRHRVRLAETRAAEGDRDGAGEELIALGRALLTRGAIAEAERAFNRAAELLPSSDGPLLGLSECLVADGREDEALSKLEEATGKEPAPSPLVAELAWHYAQNGRYEEALTLLRKTELLEVSLSTWLKLFSLFVDRGDVLDLWTELDPLFKACEKTNAESLVGLLEQLEHVEQHGHAPALERLYELRMRQGETEGCVRTLESLVVAYRARSMTAEVNQTLERLEKLAPVSRAPVAPAADATHELSQTPDVAVPAGRSAVAAHAGRPRDDAPLEAEAPAVPLNRSDEEFVAGRLTQADVLEKYGLQPQALEQVESVTARFPGHVQAQQKRVELLRSTADAARIAEALAGLALAQRAAGDNAGAVESAREASSGELRQQTLLVLQQCRLIEGGEEPAAPAPPFADAPVLDPLDPVDAGPVALPDEPLVVPTSQAIPEGEKKEAVATEESETVVRELEPTAVQEPERAGGADGGVDLVIDFDAEPSDEAPADEPPLRTKPQAVPSAEVSTGVGAGGPSTTTPKTRVPGPDMLGEIGDCIASGAYDEASRRIDTLRALGYASEALDALNSSIGTARDIGVAPIVMVDDIGASTDESEPTAALVSPDESQTTKIEDELDLSAIEAALQEELLESEQPVVTEEHPEQSLEEVFSSFKAAVKEQVGEEDHGTHYDLGIAYKEMGLVDESIAEFELAAKAPEFTRRSLTMIGLCYWERQELEPAVDWYRKAIDAAKDEGADVVNHLRYDLGEVLLQLGDPTGALSEFRRVAEIDPNYREVSSRVGELEEQLQI